MTNGREKSDPAIVAAKLANKAGDRRRSWWSEGRGQGERGPEAHAPNTGSGSVSQSWNANGKRQASPSDIQGRAYAGKPHVRIVRGRASNARPYRERGGVVGNKESKENRAVVLDCLCAGLAPLAEFGFGLDRAWPHFNMHNMESVHANRRREPNS